jgi:hypothetical protein
VLPWISSPNPPFGGYGPSFVNPRTGEILGPDIMLEYVHFTNRLYYDSVFRNASSLSLQILSEEEEKVKFFKDKENHLFCSKGHLMHENTLFGQTVLAAAGASDLEMEGMKKEGMKSLIMHEVGHTFGLRHNRKASQLFTPEQLADATFIKGKALTGFVMDYAGINLTLDRSKQGQYYDMAVGPYDLWAIQFRYTLFNTAAEKNAVLAQSTKPELIFGNDADDMRSPGKAIDPRVMIGDLSNDQIRYSVDRIKLVNKMMKDIKPRFRDTGESYMQLRQAYYILSGQSAAAAGTISRFIADVYIDRAAPGQKGGMQPFIPVSLKDQKRAMDALETFVFAPDAFTAPNELYNYLAKQRRGFNFVEGPEGPKIHEQVLSHQTRVLVHIMHPNTLERISNSGLYGNEYKLSLFMTDLNSIMFALDIYGTVNSFRQNLQAAYKKGLISMISGKTSSRYSVASRSMAIYNLNSIKTLLRSKNGDIATKAHKAHLEILITNVLKEIK